MAGEVHDRVSFREELIQVAAVAVAIVEDMDTGSASRDGLAQVIADVGAERMRQQQKWGDQHHDDPIVWLAILAEEVGEVARTFDKTGLSDSEKALVYHLADAETVARWILDHWDCGGCGSSRCPKCGEGNTY